MSVISGSESSSPLVGTKWAIRAKHQQMRGHWPLTPDETAGLIWSWATYWEMFSWVCQSTVQMNSGRKSRSLLPSPPLCILVLHAGVYLCSTLLPCDTQHIIMKLCCSPFQTETLKQLPTTPITSSASEICPLSACLIPWSRLEDNQIKTRLTKNYNLQHF